MLRSGAVRSPNHSKPKDNSKPKNQSKPQVVCYTVAQAQVITGVPAKLINQYLDRELEDQAVIGAGFRAVTREGLVAVRLNYEYCDLLMQGPRLELIKEALANPRKKAVNCSGGQVSARVDVARSMVGAGLNKFRNAMSLVDKIDEVLCGEPCLKGTRLSMYVIHGLYNACGRDEVKNTYSDLADLEIDAAVTYAEMFPRRGRPRSVESRLSTAKPTRSRVIRVKPIE